MNIRLAAIIGAALCASTITTTWGQAVVPDPAIPPLAPMFRPPSATSRAIRLKYVRPSLMAYWLDPKHNPAPFLTAPSGLNPYLRNTPQSPGPFELPGGIEQLVSVDPQNVLLVAGGSDDDIRRLRELIDVLDQPLRGAELEVQAVRVRAGDALRLGIGFSPAADAARRVPLSFRAQSVRGNFQSRLLELLGDQKAQLLATARLTMDADAPAQLTIPQSKDQGPKAASIRLSIAQVVGVDDSIVLSIEASSDQKDLSDRRFDSALPSLIVRPAQTKDAPGFGAVALYPLRDGQTIALLDFKSISSLFPLNEDGNGALAMPGDAPSEVVVFLTPRLTRRAGDAPVVPEK